MAAGGTAGPWEPALLFLLDPSTPTATGLCLPGGRLQALTSPNPPRRWGWDAPGPSSWLLDVRRGSLVMGRRLSQEWPLGPRRVWRSPPPSPPVLTLQAEQRWRGWDGSDGVIVAWQESLHSSSSWAFLPPSAGTPLSCILIPMGDLGWRCPEGGCRINWVREQKGSHVEWQRILFFVISSYSLYLFSCIFNWKRVALEWCVGFHQQNQSSVYTPPLLAEPPAHPTATAELRLGPERWAELPAYHRSSHQLCFARGSVQMSTWLSQFIPQLLPLCVHKSILCVCISISALQNLLRFISTIFLDSILYALIFNNHFPPSDLCHSV